MSKDKNNKSESTAKDPVIGFIDKFPKRTMWREIAKELGGEFKIKHTASVDLETHITNIPYKNWNINFTVSETRPLRVTINFKSVLNFKMILSWEDVIEQILNKLGKKPIEVGDEDFDKRYVIKCNKAEFIKRLFTKDIQKIFLKYNIYSLYYETNNRKKTSELVSVIQRNAGGKEMIRDIVIAFKLLIDNLLKYNIIKN